MKRNSLITASLIFLAFTAILHLYAVAFYVYWSLPWFDIIVHGLGGIAVGFFALWIDTPLDQEFASPFSLSSLIIVLGGTLFIGLLWELFEYSFGITSLASANFLPDTLRDLAMDIIGGILSLLYIGFKK
ncbi:MAG: hypothetical protein PHV42_01370 [Candidatus Pacebacteria bacterium]|nr:hypothetical protein [Candidatus Paceibacterota bacterium]